MKDKTKAVKQLGVKLDAALWKQMKMLALQEDKTATELMNKAMAEFIARHRGRGRF